MAKRKTATKKKPAATKAKAKGKPKATKAELVKAGPERTWQIQTEPHEALAAMALRYLRPKQSTSFDRLFQMIWDDLTECVFWTRESLDGGNGKVFMHGLGMMRMDTRRQAVKDDLRSALTALTAAGTTGVSNSTYRLRSHEARADWLAARPPRLLAVYNTLTMTHDGWEEAKLGLERFANNGTLKDPRDEQLRQLTLERDQLVIDLAEARGLLKTHREASKKRRELSGLHY